MVKYNTEKLFESIRVGDLKAVKDFLNKNPNTDIDKKDEAGNNALQWASWNGHLEVVEYLLNLGANPDSQDENGWTSLNFATHRGSFKNYDQIVKCLLEHGANPDIASFGGITPVEMAKHKGFQSIIDLYRVYKQKSILLEVVNKTSGEDENLDEVKREGCRSL